MGSDMTYASTHAHHAAEAREKAKELELRVAELVWSLRWHFRGKQGIPDDLKMPVQHVRDLLTDDHAKHIANEEP